MYGLSGPEDLYGTWRLLSYSERDVATGETNAFFGKAPHGFLNYARDGRMFAILAKDERPRPKDSSKATVKERAELFNSMGAYAGRFTLDGNAVTHHVEISWNENWTGTDQVRNLRLEGDRLYITTDPQPNDVNGKMIIAELVWEKVK